MSSGNHDRSPKTPDLMEEKVIESFHRSIQAKMAVGEQLAPKLSVAAQHIAKRFLQGSKLLVGGYGASQHLTNHFQYCLSQGLGFERPALPVILMDNTPNPFVGSDRLDGNVLSRQINALSQADDLLLLISAGDSPETLTQAIIAAHDCKISSIVLTGPGDTLLSEELDTNDMELSSGTGDQLRNQEIQLLIIFCLCELIEYQLFGGTPQ